jgi:hypothetical protein
MVTWKPEMSEGFIIFNALAILFALIWFGLVCGVVALPGDTSPCAYNIESYTWIEYSDDMDGGIRCGCVEGSSGVYPECH